MAIRFVIRGESIQLDQLLKATGLSPTGGAAKADIAAGMAKVDGQVELRKRAQLKPGQRVEYGGETIDVAAPAPGEAPAKKEPRAPQGARPPRPAQPAARPKGVPTGRTTPRTSGSKPAAPRWRSLTKKG